MQKSTRELKTIKIFEPGGKYNKDGEDILDNVSEGVILIDELNKFEGIIYKNDAVEFIKGYLGKEVISVELLDKSIYALRMKDDTFDGVIDYCQDQETDTPCKVILGKLKENNNIDTDVLRSKIILLRNDKVMNLERTLKR